MRLVSCLVLTVVAGGAWAQQSEFRQNNEYWYFREGGWSIHGILVKPQGKGPFPAILVSHGQGATSETFALRKAEEFAKWGVVTIAVDYTHALNGEPGSGGYSKENLRRAMKCLSILRDQPYVDGDRIAAYGDSMGAFLTIGLAAESRAKLKAAIVTAGGLSAKEGYAAPTAEVAKKIRVPFLILHGENDAVVPAERSERLKTVLDENKVDNERKVYPGAGHDIQRSQESDVLADIKSWLVKCGVLKA